MRFTTRLLKKHFYVSTPIFYPNAAPHVGHLYSALLADAQARWRVIKEEHKEVTMSTGTDEHGIKIAKKARLANIECQSYCDQVSVQFRDLFKLADIRYTDFIRTTQPRHQEAVNTFWTRLSDRGFIYKSNYEGWYSANDECFLTENQTEVRVSTVTGKSDRFSLESGHPVEHISESNYMFRLASFKQQLREYVASGAVVSSKYAEVLHDQIDCLQDLSVSREARRVEWGVPVPGDPGQTVYVWLDALVNYLTVAGYPNENTRFSEMWPADVHVVGKDILRFHALYWPAFLMAADLPVPKQILCHGHWLVDNHKMSKSIGNVIDPVECIDKFGRDCVRYFLLREGVPDADSNLSLEKFTKFADAELSNTLGNLYQRCLSFNPAKRYPCYMEIKDLLTQEDNVLLDKLDEMTVECDNDYMQFNFYKGLQRIMAAVRMCNSVVQETRPWVLAKSDQNKDKLELTKLLFLVYETLRVAGILLQPVVPALSEDLLTRLGVEKRNKFMDAKVTKSKICMEDMKLEKKVLFSKSKKACK